MGSDQATTNLWKGMVFPKCWIGLVWTIAFCVAQTQALLSEDELVRALLAAREAEDSGYMMRGALPVMEKRRQQAFSAWAGKRGGRPQAFSRAGKRAPFSSWAGKRSGEMPIYHEVPEYASSTHMRRKRSSGESFEESGETVMEKRSRGDRETGLRGTSGNQQLDGKSRELMAAMWCFGRRGQHFLPGVGGNFEVSMRQ